MSAPQTNLDKQKRRHRGPLIGMIVVVAFALTLLFFQMMDTAEQGQPTDSQGGSIDGRTGAPSEENPPTVPTVPIPAPAPVDPPVQP